MLNASDITDINKIGPLIPYLRLIISAPAPTSPLGHMPTLSANLSLYDASLD